MQTGRTTLPSAGWWEAGSSLGLSSGLCLGQLGTSARQWGVAGCALVSVTREGNPLLRLPVKAQWGWWHWLRRFINEMLISSPSVWMLFLFSLLLFCLLNWEPHKDYKLNKSEIEIYLWPPFTLLCVPSLFSWVPFLLHSPPSASLSTLSYPCREVCSASLLVWELQALLLWRASAEEVWEGSSLPL